MRPAELHSRSVEENCSTENVASLRSVKVATPPCAAKAAIPCGLAVRKQHEMLFAASKFDINKSEFERRKLMYPLISVFIIVVGALLLVFANKIIKNNKVNRIGIKVVGGILIIVGLLLLYFLLSGKLTLPLSK